MIDDYYSSKQHFFLLYNASQNKMMIHIFIEFYNSKNEKRWIYFLIILHLRTLFLSAEIHGHEYGEFSLLGGGLLVDASAEAVQERLYGVSTTRVLSLQMLPSMLAFFESFACWWKVKRRLGEQLKKMLSFVF